MGKNSNFKFIQLINLFFENCYPYVFPSLIFALRHSDNKMENLKYSVTWSTAVAPVLLKRLKRFHGFSPFGTSSSRISLMSSVHLFGELPKRVPVRDCHSLVSQHSACVLKCQFSSQPYDLRYKSLAWNHVSFKQLLIVIAYVRNVC